MDPRTHSSSRTFPWSPRAAFLGCAGRALGLPLACVISRSFTAVSSLKYDSDRLVSSPTETHIQEAHFLILPSGLDLYLRIIMIGVEPEKVVYDELKAIAMDVNLHILFDAGLNNFEGTI
ncbi:hypothetical protein NLI96_g458 [Meripilus lineatus]|uniref:Uncharacterized protein n=1 Tax=Meripilus lineatus TaxID=2056292 RepID=A0AAD5YNW3_9APHY|nr:hypothetical protein NLI96_g458 [Physisporinus lineatus]